MHNLVLHFKPDCVSLAKRRDGFLALLVTFNAPLKMGGIYLLISTTSLPLGLKVIVLFCFVLIFGREEFDRTPEISIETLCPCDVRGVWREKVRGWLHNEGILVKSPDPSAISPNSVPFSPCKLTPEAERSVLHTFQGDQQRMMRPPKYLEISMETRHCFRVPWAHFPPHSLLITASKFRLYPIQVSKPLLLILF